MQLTKFLQLKSSFGWSLSNPAAMLRFELLTRRAVFWAGSTRPSRRTRRNRASGSFRSWPANLLRIENDEKGRERSTVQLQYYRSNSEQNYEGDYGNPGLVIGRFSEN
jgi:hypothetical protein